MIDQLFLVSNGMLYHHGTVEYFVLNDLPHLLRDRDDVDVSPVFAIRPYDVDKEITYVFTNARRL